MIVAVSPLWSKSVRRSKRYANNLADWLRKKSEAKGFTLLLERAISVPSNLVGDSEDHIHPSVKADFTRWFAAQLLQAPPFSADSKNNSPAPSLPF